MSDFEKEFGYLLDKSPAGISVYKGGKARAQRVLNWLSHPVGTVADDPAWGNPLRSIHLEPQSDDLAIITEMIIIEKLPQDVPDLNIKRISIEYVSIDEIMLTIEDDKGQISMQLPKL